MTAFTVDDSATLSSIYVLAMTVLREIEVGEETGRAKCRCCGNEKTCHIHDGRCSCSALSREFTNVRHDERVKAKSALELIEKLRSL